jgi:hypothetical protein
MCGSKPISQSFYLDLNNNVLHYMNIINDVIDNLEYYEFGIEVLFLMSDELSWDVSGLIVLYLVLLERKRYAAKNQKQIT